MGKKNYELWKTLIIGNLILTLFLFWILYSQISYLTNLVEKKLPITIPEVTSHTAIVTNPITGSFIFINLPIIPVVLISIIIIFGLIYLFRSH